MYYLQETEVDDKDKVPRRLAIRSFHPLRSNLLLHMNPVVVLVPVIRVIERCFLGQDCGYNWKKVTRNVTISSIRLVCGRKDKDKGKKS